MWVAAATLEGCCTVCNLVRPCEQDQPDPFSYAIHWTLVEFVCDSAVVPIQGFRVVSTYLSTK